MHKDKYLTTHTLHTIKLASSTNPVTRIVFDSLARKLFIVHIILAQVEVVEVPQSCKVKHYIKTDV